MSDKLRELNKAANEVTAIDEQVETLMSEVQALNKRRYYLLSERMPDIMGELDVRSLTRGKRQFDLSMYVSGTWPKTPDGSKRAAAYLEATGNDGLIKTELKALFPRGKYDQAMETAELISPVCTPIVTVGVHPQTLQAFGRRELHAGRAIRLDILGLHAGRIVKVKKLKSRKK